MKSASEEQERELEELYIKYYSYICKWYLGHSFENLRRPSYHKRDFIDFIEDEALTIKINEGY